MNGRETEPSIGDGGMARASREKRPLGLPRSNWLMADSVGQAMDGSNSVVSRVPIPFPIRMTVNQLLDLADETELRAVTLRWMNGSRAHSPQKAWRLLQIAAELRQTADRLLSEVELDSAGVDHHRGDVRLTLAPDTID
jgi:hypothetical protein